MTEFLVAAMTVLILWLTRLFWRRYAEFRALARPVGASGDRQGPSVTVLVPARNEEANIGKCLSALLAQTYRNLQVIVIDDHSTDRTPEIIRSFASDPRLRSIPAPPLPSGWKGKCHALWTGARAAQGEWLFFLDADTFAGPDLLSAAVSHAEKRKVDMISVLPQQDLGSLSEKIVQPIAYSLVLLFLPPARANDPHDPLGHVTGQCFGVRRPAYEAVEGHKNEAVRTMISEDRALGQVVKSAGFRLEIVDGRHLVHTRMFSGFNELWNGWAKHFGAGLGHRKVLVPLSLFGSLAAVAYLGMALGQGIGAASNGSLNWVALLGVLMPLYLLVFLGFMRWKVGQVFGQPAWYAITYPAGLVVVAGIAFTALFRSAFGLGLEWKGRRIT